MAVSGDGKWLATPVDHRHISVRNPESGQETVKLSKNWLGNVSSLVFTSDGGRLFSASHAGLIIWDTRTGQAIRAVEGENSGAFRLALSADDKRLVAAYGKDQDHVIKAWDLETDAEPVSLRGHTDFVAVLALSPDGQVLFTASDDKTVKMWDLETGKETMSLRGYGGSWYGHALALSGNGQRLTYAADKGSILVWNLDVASRPWRHAFIKK
jgi:WD40 repeat protein